MLDNLDGQIEAARARRALTFENHVPTASRFDPRLPGCSPVASAGAGAAFADPRPTRDRCPTRTRTSPSRP